MCVCERERESRGETEPTELKIESKRDEILGWMEREKEREIERGGGDVVKRDGCTYYICVAREEERDSSTLVRRW